ncbi:MAG TPA: flagellar filament capping protein FliD [Pirellulales bacterium]
MASVSTGVGLISGINTSAIVDALIQADSGPLTSLQNEVSTAGTQKTDLLGLSADLLAVQNDATALKNSSVLNARAATSNSSSLSVAADNTAALGSYQLQVLQLAQNQQLVSSGFASANSTVGAGTITIKQGGSLNTQTPLDQLNGGAGVAAGTIRITSGNGTSATVNLSTAQTLNDVVSAINNTAGIGVTASLTGQGLELTNLNGATGAISVADVNNTTTAEDLGLTGGATQGSSLLGTNLITLSDNTQLSTLNDGNGVSIAGNSADFVVNLQNGSQVSVTLGSASTIGDVINAINNASGAAGNLSASISSDGTHLVLTDSTTGSNTLSVSAVNASQAAQDLGILGTAPSGGVLDGGQVLAGVNSVLLKDLNGGSGVGTLGTLDLTDRSGATATVDLSSASSLSDVINGINSAGIGLHASLNSAGDGIQVLDTTGSANSNLIIADGSGSTLAAQLNIATNVATSSVNSGDLNLQYISDNTQLSGLNGGSGVAAGEIKVTDSTGASQIVNLSSAQSIGDVINALNSSGLHIQASINSAGDGILVTDNGGGAGQLSIAEQGGTTAANLNLLGTATGGQIDGAMETKITLSSTDKVSDLMSDLAASNAPLTATTINDGSGSNPLRMLFRSSQSGAAGNLVIDTGTTGLKLSTLDTGTNAVLSLSDGAGGSPLVMSSSSNTFSTQIPGLTITASQVMSSPTTVTVTQNTQPLANAIGQFVSDFNTAYSQYQTLTSYNTTTNSGGDLYNDPIMEQIGLQLNSLIGQTFGASNSANATVATTSNPVQSLADLGITYSNGQLSLNQTALTSQLTSNASAVSAFFNTAKTGFADSVSTQLDSITNAYNGAITEDVNGLADKVTGWNNQIAIQNAYLKAQRTQLQTQFLAMEQAMATLQSQQSALGSLQNISASSGSGSSSSSASSSSSNSSATSNGLASASVS